MRNDRMAMNYELIRIWKQVDIVYYRELLQHFADDTKES